MGHAHHGHDHRPGSERRLLISVALNVLISVAELVGGIVSGSLALLSDALHNFSDASSLGVSYAARRIGRRDPNRQKTFGYKRAEIIAALVNLVTLVLIALFLMVEAVQRFFEPREIDGTVMLVVALIGLAANLATAWLLYQDVEGSLNLKSAFLHIVADAVSSVGVVIGGWLIIQYGITWVDPVLTLLIACYILYHSYSMLRQTIDILMESTPEGIDLGEVVDAVQALDAVVDVHHVHVWQLDETHVALEAHVVIDEDDLPEMESIKRTVKACLEARFGIDHSTLEFETVRCDHPGDPHCYDEAAVVRDE